MDSNKILIGFVVLVVAFLAFPIVATKIRGQNTAFSGNAASAAAQQASGGAQNEFPELNQPPLLNEMSLINTEWQVQVEQYKVKVTLKPNGVAYATHPMAKAMTGLDYLEGRWRVQNDRIYVNTMLGGNEYSIELRISGTKIYAINKKGKPSEVKRYQ